MNLVYSNISSSGVQTLVIFILTTTIFGSVSSKGIRSTDLISTDQPRFTTRGETHTVVNGESVILPCEAENLDPFTIVWKRGNVVLTATQLKITRDPRFELVDGYNLKVTNATAKDGGQYVCVITTSDMTEQVHMLEVLVPPSVTIESINGYVTVIKGDTVTLKCRANGNPSPSIRWTRRNNLLPGGEQSAEGSSFTIQKADRYMAGMYVCSASNGVDSPATSVVEVKVHYPPEIEVEKTWVHSEVGYDVELVCEIQSQPPPIVRWFLDTMIVDSYGRRIIDQRDSRHTLKIRKVMPGDFGNYSCEGVNKLGTTRKYIVLSGKPDRPVIRSHPDGQLKDAYNIIWAVESFPPILEYRLIYRKANVNNTHDMAGYWNDLILPTTESPEAVTSLAAPLSASTLHVGSYHIRNLEPQGVYEARVAARNKYGWTNPSKVFTFSTQRIQAESQNPEIGDASSFTRIMNLLLFIKTFCKLSFLYSFF